MNNRQAIDTHGSGARIRLRHHQFVTSQYRSGGPWVRGKRGYGLAVGRRGELILGFPLKLFQGKCPTGMTCHPKEGKMSWNHQVHAMRDSEREYPPLSGWECHSEQENKIRLFVWEWDVARPTQVSGDGQATDRPVGDLRRIPISGQKRLRGKTVKTRHGRQYKMGLSRAQGG